MTRNWHEGTHGMGLGTDAVRPYFFLLSFLSSPAQDGRNRGSAELAFLSGRFEAGEGKGFRPLLFGINVMSPRYPSWA